MSFINEDYEPEYSIDKILNQEISNELISNSSDHTENDTLKVSDHSLESILSKPEKNDITIDDILFVNDETYKIKDIFLTYMDINHGNSHHQKIKELIVKGAIYLFYRCQRDVNHFCMVIKVLLDLYIKMIYDQDTLKIFEFIELNNDLKEFIDLIEKTNNKQIKTKLFIVQIQEKSYVILENLLIKLLNILQNYILNQIKTKSINIKQDNTMIITVKNLYEIMKICLMQEIKNKKEINLGFVNDILMNVTDTLRFIFSINQYKTQYLEDIYTREPTLDLRFYFYYLALNFKFKQENEIEYYLPLNEKELESLCQFDDDGNGDISDRGLNLKVIRDGNYMSSSNLYGLMDVLIGNFNFGILSIQPENQKEIEACQQIMENLLYFFENLFDEFKRHIVYEIFSPKRSTLHFLKSFLDINNDNYQSKRIITIIITVLIKYKNEKDQQFCIILNDIWNSLISQCKNDKKSLEKINSLLDAMVDCICCFYNQQDNNVPFDDLEFNQYLNRMQNIMKTYCKENNQEIEKFLIQKRKLRIDKLIYYVFKYPNEFLVQNKEIIFDIVFNYGLYTLSMIFKHVETEINIPVLIEFMQRILLMMNKKHSLEDLEIIKNIFENFKSFINEYFGKAYIIEIKKVSFQRRYLSFLINFLICLINNQNEIDLSSIWANDLDEKPCLEEFLIISENIKFHHDEIIPELLAQIIDNIVNVLEINQSIKAKNLIWQYLFLILNTISNVPSARNYFRQSDIESKLFIVLYKMHEINQFSSEEIRELLMILMNFATNCELAKIFNPNYLSNEKLLVEEIAEFYEVKESWKYIKYANIKYEYCIVLVVKLIFIFEIEDHIKKFYISLMDDLLKYSSVNSITCGKGKLLSFLLIFLKIEDKLEIKELIANLIIHIMKVVTNVCHIKAIMKATRNDQKYTEFIKNLSEYTKLRFTSRILDVSNHFITQKILINIIKTLFKEPKLNQNFISFSGVSSGLILSRIFLPNDTFSITISFFATNLVSNHKENIINCLINNQKISKSNRFSVHATLTKDRLSIKDNYFENYSKKLKISKKLILQNLKETKLNYDPRLLCLYGKKNYSLEIYIESDHDKGKITIGENNGKGKVTKIHYELSIEENNWYNMVIIYSKGNFTTYIDPKAPMQVSNPTKFSLKGKKIKYMTIGCPLFKEHIARLEDMAKLGIRENIDDYFIMDDNFIGFITNFAIFDEELSIQRVKTFFDNVKIKEDSLISSSLVNINAFPGINKPIEFDEVAWSSNDSHSSKKLAKMLAEKNKKLGLISMPLFFKNDKLKIDQSEYIALGKGLTYNEKFKFEDIFFSTGNIDIFFMAIEILMKMDNQIDSEKKQMLFCGWIKIIAICCYSICNKNEALEYLTNDGMDILVMLTNQFFKSINNDISRKTIERLRCCLIEEIPQPNLKFFFCDKLFFNFDIWEKCDMDHYIYLFNKIFEDLMLDKIFLWKYYKQKLLIKRFFYWMETELNHNSAQIQKSPLLGNEAKLLGRTKSNDSNKFAAFRECILNAIFETISDFSEPEILKKELQILLKYIYATSSNSNKCEYLELLYRLAKLKTDQRALLYKCLFDIQGFEVLIQIFIKFNKNPYTQNISDELYYEYLDHINSFIIHIFNILILNNRDMMTKSNFHDDKLNKNTKQKNFAHEILKIIKGYLYKNFGFLTCNALINLLKACEKKLNRNDSRLIDTDYIIEFVLEKFFDMENNLKIKFLKEVNENIENDFDSLKLLLNSSSALEFLVFLANNICWEKPAEENPKKYSEYEYATESFVYSSFGYFLIKEGGYIDIFKCILQNDEENFLIILQILSNIFINIEKYYNKAKIQINPIINQPSIFNTQLRDKLKDVHLNDQFITNIIQFMNYLLYKCTNKSSQLWIQNHEKQLGAFIDSAILLFQKINIIYCTMPEIKQAYPVNFNLSNMADIIPKNTFHMNGGLLFTLMKIIIKLLKEATHPIIKQKMILCANFIMNGGVPHLDIKKSPSDMQNKIKFCNDLLKKIMKIPYPYIQIEDNRVNDVLYLNSFIFYKLCKLIYTEFLRKNQDLQEVLNDPGMIKVAPGIYSDLVNNIEFKKPSSDLKIKNSIDNYYLSDLLLIICRVINSSSSQIKIHALLISEEENASSDRDKKNLLQNPINSRPDIDIQKISNKNHKVTQDKLEALIKLTLNGKKSSASAIIKNKYVEIFEELEFICKECDKSCGLKQHDNEIKEEHMSYIWKIYDHFMKFKTQYVDAILPCIKYTIGNYHKFLKVLNEFYFKQKIESISSQIPKFPTRHNSDFEIEYVSNTKLVCDKIYSDFKTMNKKKYTKKANYIEKIHEKWQATKDKLGGERGIWSLNEVAITTKVIYKIENREDLHRRKMKIKIDKNSQNKRYLSYQTSKNLIKIRSMINLDEKPKLCGKSKTLLTLDEADSPEKTTPKSKAIVNYNTQAIISKFDHTSIENVQQIKLFSTPQTKIKNSNDPFNQSSNKPPLIASIETTPNTGISPLKPKNPRKLEIKINVDKADRFYTVQSSSCFNSPLSKHKSPKLGTNSKKESIESGLKQNILDVYTLDNDQEKNILKMDSEKISIKGSIWGRIELSKSYFTFLPYNTEKPDHLPYILGALDNNSKVRKAEERRTEILMNDINQVFSRSYNLLPMSFEIFCKNGKTFFFNVFTNENQQKVLYYFKNNQKHIDTIIDRVKDFENKEYTEKWLNGQISNFEYLMLVNTYAGRTYNDISQYPIFPWVIKDFKSSCIDIYTKDPTQQANLFRNLTRPIGFQNDDKREILEKRFNDCDDLFGKFYYGTHYSTPGGIMGLLIRLEPFTTQAIKLQNNRFDEPNRLFSSLTEQWDLIFNEGDVRELTPEFYYLPEILKNINKYEFGKKQNGVYVNDVILPPWADTPEKFIIYHREALESDYVSLNLCEWIDLIFGYKQRNSEAKKAMNLYVDTCYENKIQIENLILEEKSKLESGNEKAFYNSLKSKITQINCFGQIPQQMFFSSHRRKNIDLIRAFKSSIFDMGINRTIITKKNTSKHSPNHKKAPTGNHKVEKMKEFECSLLGVLDNISINCIFKDSKAVYILANKKDLYHIQFIEQVGNNNNNARSSRVISKTFSILKLGDLIINENNIQTQFSFISNYNSQSYLIIGGFIDNTFGVIKDKEVIQRLKYHKRPVTSISQFEKIPEKQYFIVCGSKDCKITVWECNLGNNKDIIEKKPKNIIYGHHNEIIIVHVVQSLALILSTDADGIILISCIYTGRIIRCLYPELESNEYIKFLLGHDSGLIAIITTKGNLILYSINSKDILDKKYLNINQIKQAQFVDQIKPLLFLITSDGQKFIYDILKMSVILDLNKYILNNKSDNKKYTEELEKHLKYSEINCFFYDNVSLYLGTNKGALVVISL